MLSDENSKLLQIETIFKLKYEIQIKRLNEDTIIC